MSPWKTIGGPNGHVAIADFGRQVGHPLQRPPDLPCLVAGEKLLEHSQTLRQPADGNPQIVDRFGVARLRRASHLVRQPSQPVCRQLCRMTP